MSEPVEHIEMSDQDEKDLAKLLAEGQPPEFHPVLEVWREVLAPAKTLAKEKITPQYASKMVATYPRLEFTDMPKMQTLYFDKIDQLAEILDEEIAKDRECLTYRTPEEDVENNSGHYKDLLRDWQLRFLQWELDWDTTQPDAPVELAAISEVHKMFFGQQGVTAFLDNIKFQFTEEDQTALAEALTELRESQVTRDE